MTVFFLLYRHVLLYDASQITSKAKQTLQWKTLLRNGKSYVAIDMYHSKIYLLNEGESVLKFSARLSVFSFHISILMTHGQISLSMYVLFTHKYFN